MKFYFYRAFSEEGSSSSGFILASDEEELFRILERRGLYAYKLIPIPRLLGTLFYGGVKREDLIEFSKNMSIMIKAGISVIWALESLKEQTKNRAFKNALIDIIDLVKRGMSLSEAFSLYPHFFPPIFPYLIKGGEQTGRLDKVFEDIGNHLQRIEELKIVVQRALLYPIFATIASVGAILFWLIYVLPKVAFSMRDMGVNLPTVTLIMMGIGEFLKNYFWTLFIGFFLIFIGYTVVKDKSQIKTLKDKILLKLPVIKTLVFLRTMVIFSEQMRILLETGIPIDVTFERVKNAVENTVVKKAVEKAKESVLLGKRLSEALRETKIFPQMIINFVEVGERTGRLADQFSTLSEHYANKTQEYSLRLGKIIEPVIIGVIGLFFALVIVSLFIPVYEMISRIGMSL